MTLHICAPQTVTFRRLLDCPTCKKRRRFVILNAVWYDGIATCCGCGDSFSDGYRMQRPFARGWRAREVERAKRLWNSALPKAEAWRQFRELCEVGL